MSKISLTPNAAGTGTFSIASPNSNTNRTITLPDEAGELLVNGTTSNVGIGTSSPQGHGVHIVPNGGNTALFLSSPDGDANTHEVNIAALNKVNTGWQPLNIKAYQTKFWSNGTEAMRIDSSGNVGIGVVPSAWAASSTALQIGSLAFDDYSVGGANLSGIYNNAFRNTSGNVVYKETDFASTYTQYNGEHIFKVAPSGSANATISFTEAMRIDASGNVGIGTSSPSAPLHVSGNGRFDNSATTPVRLHINNSGSNDYASLYADTASAYKNLVINPNGGNVGIGTNSPTGAGTILHLNGSGTVADFHMTNTTSGVASTDGFMIRYSGLNAEFLNREAGASIFYTSATERMRLSPGGALALANTGLPTNGTAGVTLSPAGNVHCGLAGTSAADVMRMDNANGRVGSITVSGSSTSYNSASDYRLKTDAQPLTGASVRVQALNPVNFEWLSDGTRVDGFLAHEAQAVVPECATGTKDAMRDEEYEVTAAIEATYDDDGNELTAAVEAVMGTRSVPDYQGIDQSKIVPLLTAALQEALTEITDLKARVIALESV